MRSEKERRKLITGRGLGLETELQAIGVVEKIKGGFQRKDLTGAVLLDVKKAFDRIWKMASDTS